MTTPTDQEPVKHGTATRSKLFDRAMLVAAVVLAVSLVFGLGFVLGGVYTVQKHQAKYCPDSPGRGAWAEVQRADGTRILLKAPTGCRDGEGLFD